MRPEHALLITEEQSLEKLEGGLGSVSSTTITLDELELGDHILIRPGSIPPADGTVLYGSTTVDESSLTGESLPVTKQHGDALLSGTTNLTSAVVMSVDKLGDSTMLEAIVQAVSEAQGQKAPIERLADRVTSFFVPVVIWLSVVVLAVWLGVSLSGVIPDSFLDSNRTSTGDRVFFAFEFAIATLVVACPCGIGLAAPTAQAVGSGMAARAGILAQGGGEAFQLASAVDTVVFDKTGTLTTGDTVVVDSDDSTDAPIWLGEAIRALEEGSSHPLAIAIANYYTASGSKPLHPIRVLRSEEVPGKGVKGVIQYEAEEFEVISGNEGFVRVDNGAQGVTSLAEEWKSSGKSLVLVAISPLGPEPSTFKIVASLAISDTPRPEAADTVAKLKKSGKEVWMLSGDNPLTAKAVGRNLGIDEANV
jgi:Cu+-exporting ATPase